jgi:hypothetical protein
MLDETMQAFQVETEARKPLRPSGRRHGAETDTMSGVGAALLARKIRDFCGIRAQMGPNLAIVAEHQDRSPVQYSV